MEHIEKVLAALSENELTDSAEKCIFFQTEVVFLGFVIFTSGISMDPKKITLLVEWLYPKEIGDLSNSYRNFIPIS